MPYVNSDGVNIYYESYGQGVPIVFLHAFSTNGYIWYFQIFPFAQTNQAVFIDQRGHGRSDKPQQGYSIQQNAKDVGAVMDGLGIDRAVLVGNSIGGMIALQFSLDYPERVLGNLILSSGTGLYKYIPNEAMEVLQSDGYVEAFNEILDVCISAKSKQNRGEILDVMKSQFLAESIFPRHSYMASVKDPSGVFNWDITDRLKEISVPTLVLAGAEDLAVPVEVNKVLADNIPGAELRVIPEVGHFYQLEQPRAFSEELRGFVKKVSG